MQPYILFSFIFIALIFWFFFITIKKARMLLYTSLCISLGLLTLSILLASKTFIQSIINILTTHFNIIFLLAMSVFLLVIYYGIISIIKTRGSFYKIPIWIFLLGIFFLWICRKLAPCLLRGRWSARSYSCVWPTLPTDKAALILLLLTGLVLIMAFAGILYKLEKK